MNFERDHDGFVDRYDGRRPQRLNISKGRAMEVSSNWCADEIRSVEATHAGGHGPPPDLSNAERRGNFLSTFHGAMCSDHCLASDSLRTKAMAASRCDCVQLSTKEGDMSYTREGDFCLRNSGEILCEEVDLDVNSECELKDFACARREYDRIQVPVKGYGNECNAGPVLGSALVFGATILAIVTALFVR
jgi:hypothetical protein